MVPTGGIPIAASEIPSQAPCKPAAIPPASPYVSVACGKKPVRASAAAPIAPNGFIEPKPPPDPPGDPTPDPPAPVFIAIII
jgi:hypothetical protein